MPLIAQNEIDTYLKMNIPDSSATTIGMEEWEQLSTSITELMDSLMDAIENIFLFKNENQVRFFLKENIFLLEIIVKSYAVLSELFKDSTFVLEHTIDPEYQSDNEQLVLYIVTRMEPEPAYSKLNEFDNNYWLDVVSKTEGKLCINLEFR